MDFRDNGYNCQDGNGVKYPGILLTGRSIWSIRRELVIVRAYKWNGTFFMAKKVNKNSTSVDYDDVPPSASAMMEALRAFGYELQTAIADLIDNSIFAGAKNVRLNVHWEGGKSSISSISKTLKYSPFTL